VIFRCKIIYEHTEITYKSLTVFFSEMLAIPHAHQAKILKYPPNGNFFVFYSTEVHFYRFGEECVS
ncbi:hypothetical protein ACFQZ1_00005, partial [Bacillus sp. CGMCC 1.60114]